MNVRLGFALIAMLAVGCGGGAEKPAFEVFPVKGKVTYKGQPVVGADITFHHEGGQRSAFGRTNDLGEYQLTTTSANDGAVEGKHGVTIVKMVAPPPAEPEADIESAEYQPPGYGKPASKPELPKTVLPTKYGAEATSGLIAVVETKDTNQADFELTD